MLLSTHNYTLLCVAIADKTTKKHIKVCVFTKNKRTKGNYLVRWCTVFNENVVPLTVSCAGSQKVNDVLVFAHHLHHFHL